jgi:hypothetical protein
MWTKMICGRVLVFSAPASQTETLLNVADIFRSAALLVGTASVLPPAKRERVFMGVIGTLLGVSSANAATSGKQICLSRPLFANSHGRASITRLAERSLPRC